MRFQTDNQVINLFGRKARCEHANMTGVSEDPVHQFGAKTIHDGHDDDQRSNGQRNTNQ